MATAEKHSPSEDFLRDLKALASHTRDAANALGSGAFVYIDWYGERRLRGSDAEFGDDDQRQMQRNLEKAHTHLRNAQRLSDEAPGWFSVRGMIPVDLWDSHTHAAIETAMKHHARALGIAAREWAERADGDARCEEHAEGFRRWLDWLGGCAWNLRPVDGDDPQAMTEPVLAMAKSAKRLREVGDLIHRAWEIVNASRMPNQVASNTAGATQTGEVLSAETLRKTGDGQSWTKSQLYEAASISPSTFDRIRKAAQVESSKRGGSGQSRRYTTDELTRMIKAAMAGAFRDGPAIAQKWRDLLQNHPTVNHL